MEKKYTDQDWAAIVRERYGFDPSHLTLSHSTWTLAVWDEDTAPELAHNDHRLLGRLEKIFDEIKNKPETAALPKQLKIKTSAFPDVLSYSRYHSRERERESKKPVAVQQKKNILTLTGMNEMAKRSTGQTTSTNTHHAIGIGTVTETDGDATLGTQVARKAIGSRAAVNQTEKYSTSFRLSDTGGTTTRNITEAGVFTAAAAGVMIARVTSAALQLSSGSIITVSTNVTHENGAGP